jgi:hypothetical protein
VEQQVLTPVTLVLGASKHKVSKELSDGTVLKAKRNKRLFCKSVRSAETMIDPFESKAVLLDLGSPMVGSTRVHWRTRGWSATLRARDQVD